MSNSHKIIDTHCHPQFPQFDADRDEMIRRASDAGVGMICVGTDIESSRKAIALAEQHEGIWASVGVHPNDVGEKDIDWDEIRTLLKHKKVVAVGEVGLDYYRTPGKEKQELQREALKKFFELSAESGKPLIVHCRNRGTDHKNKINESISSTRITHNAHDNLLEIIRSFDKKLSGVIHSFTGSSEQADAYIKEGLFIGLNGIVTFSREYDAMVRTLPTERILVETDAPYLAPAPYRGKRNEPVFVEKVIEHTSVLKNMNVYELRNIILNNTKSLFNI